MSTSPTAISWEGSFEPLNDIFSPEDLAAYPKNYMDQMATYEGDIIGVPHSFSWFPMYLNKRLLDEARSGHSHNR